MIKVGIMGAMGYTGVELVDLLAGHPEVEIVSLVDQLDAPVAYSEVFPKFKNKADLVCENLDMGKMTSDCDLIFLALPHTVSMKYAPAFLEKGNKVIDMSADYRLPEEVFGEWYKADHVDSENIKEAVYGLPEMNREKIQKAALIANPGCYPTSVLLPLLPLADIIADGGVEPIIDSKSGTTGAGRKGLVALSFSEVDENLKCYKVNEHQHMPEMEHVLSQKAEKKITVHFTPHLLPVRRGIMSTIYLKGDNFPSEKEIRGLYEKCYEGQSFVRVRAGGDMPHILDVAGTNFCDIGIKVSKGLVVIVSVIDNLLKGASGQAVQNMNIMSGIDERIGLI